MRFTPLLIVFIILGAADSHRSAAQERSPSPCGFSVSGTFAQPKITGPDEVTSRAIVVNQPGSPLEITAADFTGTDLRAAGGNFSVQQSWQVTVRNRSDQSVNGFTVMVAVAVVKVAEDGTWKSGGRSGAGMNWQGVLMPGDTAVATLKKGGGSGVGPDENDVRVLLSIERVDFKDCTYRPAKTMPK